MFDILLQHGGKLVHVGAILPGAVEDLLAVVSHRHAPNEAGDGKATARDVLERLGAAALADAADVAGAAVEAKGKGRAPRAAKAKEPQAAPEGKVDAQAEQAKADAQGAADEGDGKAADGPTA